MATEWEIKGRELVNCNCNFGCPCQFSVLPNTGFCEAAIVYEIESGHYGDVDLGGLRAAAIYKWPGAIHQGNGDMQLIIDPDASDEQCAALEAIMTGQDTAEMSTMWYVYSAMAPNRHPTLRKPVSLEANAAERIGEGVAEGVFEIRVKPIPNIVSGLPHRARIDLPMGFEFGQAEAASGTTIQTGGAVKLGGFADTHAHFADLHLTGSGRVGRQMAAE